MLPHVASAETTILAPASRGACPRTEARVTSTPGPRCRAAARPLPASARQAPAGRGLRLGRRLERVRVGVGLVGDDPGAPSTTGRPGGRAAAGLLDRPEDRLGRGRRGQVDATPAGPNAAAACRSASRTEKASISGGSPTAFEP